MSREEFNPFPNAKVTNKIKSSRSSGVSVSANVSAGSASSLATRGSLKKGKSGKSGLSAATPSSSKRLRGGGRY